MRNPLYAICENKFLSVWCIYFVMGEKYRDSSSNPKETTKFVSLRRHQQKGDGMAEHMIGTAPPVCSPWSSPGLNCTETLYSSADTQSRDSWVGAQCSLLNHIHLSKYHFFIHNMYFYKIKQTLKSTLNHNRHYLSGKLKSWPLNMATAAWYRPNCTTLFSVYDQYVKFSSPFPAKFP